MKPAKATVALVGSVLATASVVVLLAMQNRPWLCACGQTLFWINDAWGKHTSQHLFDPYSFTHFLHGFVFFWLAALCWPRLSAAWGLWMAATVEALWEFTENTRFVIERYRESTASIGYAGDTMINSIGDIIACTLGFLVARRLGFRITLAVYLMVEAALLVWIRDSLTLTVLMLAWPIDALKQWQAGHW